MTDARVLRGHPAVDRAVVEAVRTWRHEPGREYGTSVPVIVTVTVDPR